MSQSPIEDFSPAAVLRYRQGWNALNKLLHEDRSFSGQERNCAFLNLGDGRFADVSAATGFDFDDDGRAVACVDWDRDGDLDLWVTNRTAPRLRLLRNDNPLGSHYLAVKLRGTLAGTNVDAIGARVELHVGGAKPVTLVKTLHAGDGFLSQSSNWLHFGLGDRTTIDRLVVRWPGGEAETIRGLSVDRRYLVYQNGDAVVWAPAGSSAALAVSEPKPAESSLRARIVLPALLPAPLVQYVDRSGDEQPLLPPGHGPTLVNLWASWCQPCLEELHTWADNEKRIRDAGVSILALSVDDLDKKSGSRGAAEAILQRANFPFATGWATALAVQRLDTFQQSMLDQWRPLPIPSSFLIDRQGRVVAIYKGPVDVAQLIDDARLLTATPERRRMAGLPFEGKWSTDPPAANPLRVSTRFVDTADIPGAIDYLRRYGESTEGGQAGSAAARQLGDVYFVLAVLLTGHGQADEALAAYATAASYNGDDFRIRSSWGELLLGQWKYVEAGEQFRHALRIKPDDVQTIRHLIGVHVTTNDLEPAAKYLALLVERQPKSAELRLQLGEMYRRTGRIGEALEQFRAAVSLDPKLHAAANNLAWMLATHGDAQHRNGDEAVRVAERMCEGMTMPPASALATLSAAYAEAGRFGDAVAAIDRGIAAAEAAGDDAMAKKLRDRRELYAAKKPYRDVGSD